MRVTQDNFAEAVERQSSDLVSAAHADPELDQLRKQWLDDPFMSRLPFGAFIRSMYLEDWQHAHHHGFQQGAEAVLTLRAQRQPKADSGSKWLPWVLLSMGSFGVAVAAPFIVSADTFWVRVVAAFIGAPCLLLQGVCALHLLSGLFEEKVEANVPSPREYDPTAKAKYLEEQEDRAIRDFIQRRRSMDADRSG